MKRNTILFALCVGLAALVAAPAGCGKKDDKTKTDKAKPGGDKDKPTGDKPTGDKPTGDKPTGDKPAAGGGDVVSCDLRAEQKKCTEYRGETAEKEATHSCTEVNKGDVIKGPCPTDGWVSKCAQESAMSADTVDVVYDADGAETQKVACEAMGGKYTAAN